MFNKQNMIEEVAQQTRNGRTKVYLKSEDLKALGMTNISTTGDERIFVDADVVNELLKNYDKKSFRDNLNVTTVENPIASKTKTSTVVVKGDEGR